MEDLVEDARKSLSELIQNDAMELPEFPNFVAQIREIALEPSLTTQKLAALLASDTALSSRLIEIANSPLRPRYRHIDTITSAIYRLGIPHSCHLASRFALEQMFHANHSAIDSYLRNSWVHSVEVALVSSSLARNHTTLNPEIATLAGLVHQIGVLPVLSYVEQHKLLEKEDEGFVLQEFIDALHPEMGSLLLKTWGFSPELVSVPSKHLNYLRESTTPDYVDVVIVAKLQCYADKINPLSNIAKGTVPAFKKFGIDCIAFNSQVFCNSAHLLSGLYHKPTFLLIRLGSTALV